MSDDTYIPISVLNADFRHDFQKMLKGITPVQFDKDLKFAVPHSIPDGTYIATHDTEDHGFYHLSVYSIPAWNSLQNTIASRWPDDQDRRLDELARCNRNQNDLLVENGMCIGISQKHLDYAQVDGEGLIVGQGDCFLIMNSHNLKLSMDEQFDHDFSVVWPI